MRSWFLSRNRFFSLVAAVTPAALLLTTPAAHAQVTLFNDRTSFLAATTGITTIDFNDQVTSPSTNTNYAGGTVTLSGVTFTSNGSLFAVTPVFDPGYNLGDGAVLSFQGASPTRILTIALPTGTTAFGLDFGSFSGLPFTFGFTTASGAFTETRSGTNTSNAAGMPTFVGFTSPSSITGLFVSTTANNAEPQVDRFAFGARAVTTGAAPEPGSLALLGMGAFPLIGLVTRRRRTAQASFTHL